MTPEVSFWVGYLLKLAIVALALGALYVIGRGLRQARLFAPSNRCLRVIESVMLTPHAAVCVLRVGMRYFMLGAGSAGVAMLAELTAADIIPEAKR